MNDWRPARVLMLSYYFPPSPEVGGLRARKVAESFVRRGARVHVVAGPLVDDSLPELEIEGVEVTRVEPGPGLRTFYQRFRQRERVARAPEARLSDAEHIWQPPKHTSWPKRQISAAMWLPDDRQGWILPAARVATACARRGFDVLYSTAPPQTVHLAGLLTHRRTHLPWVAEFRDPWTDNPGKPAFVRAGWSDAIERNLERQCLSAADAIVTVTDSVAALLRSRVPAKSRNKVVVVRNGIDRLDATSRDGPVRRVVYVGNLYHGRDPRPFLNAISSIRTAGALPAGFSIHLIGRCRRLLGVSIESYVHDAGLADVVHFTDPIPHEAAIERLRSADLLLLLAQGQPLQVPNKLYEYLGVRRPILAFADANGETARMLARIGGHHVIDTDEGHVIRDVVATAIGGGTGGLETPEAERLLRMWSTQRQLDHLHAALAELIRQPGR